MRALAAAPSPWPWSVPSCAGRRRVVPATASARFGARVSVGCCPIAQSWRHWCVGPAGDQMSECDEHCSTDDGPEDREGMPVDVHDQQFGKAEHVGQ